MLRLLRPKSDFYRHVLTLMSGTVLAQAIPILLSPVLSRLYSPAEFGVFAMFTAIGAAVAVAATLRFELAIMLPETETAAINLLRLSFTITILLSLLLLGFILLFHQQLPLWLSTPELGSFQFYLPLLLLCAGGSQALNYWISRQKKFRLLAAGKVGQTGTAGVLSLLLGYCHFSSAGLIISAVAGQGAALTIYMAGSLKKILRLESWISREKIIENLRTYKSFALVNTPHALLGVLQDILVIFLLNHFFSKTIVGSYAFGFRILKVPAAFIGAAMFQVYFQKASTLKHETEKLKTLTRNVYLQMSVVGIPLFGLLLLFAPSLFALVFGNEWRHAGEIARVLSPWLLLNFICSPVAAIAVVLNRQQSAIWFAVADTLLRFAAITIGGWAGNEQLSFLLLSAGSGSLLLYSLYWFYHLPGKSLSKGY
ncbi:MAG: oligosaccharide flippase family protein [Chitinophagales bacterium]|nr:oligosaccharide flippase family protein [Chitinophagales bacterium]